MGLDATDGNFTYSSTIGGAIGIGKFGGGTVLLSGGNTYTGLTTIASGTLQLGNAAALQNSTAVLSGGVLGLNGYNATLGGLSGSGNLSLASGTLSVGNNGTSTTYSGVLSGGGSLTKIGGGLLALLRQRHVQRPDDDRRRHVANRRRRQRRISGQSNDCRRRKLALQPRRHADLLRLDRRRRLDRQAWTGDALFDRRQRIWRRHDDRRRRVELRQRALSLSNTATNKIYFSSSGALQWAVGNTQDVSANLTAFASGQTASFDTNGNNVSFSRRAADSGNLTKFGSGSLYLAPGTAISGVTTVGGGTLNFPNGKLPPPPTGSWASTARSNGPPETRRTLSTGLAAPGPNASLTLDTNGNNVTFAAALPHRRMRNARQGRQRAAWPCRAGSCVGAYGQCGSFLMTGGTLTTPNGAYSIIGGGGVAGAGTAVQNGGLVVIGQGLLMDRSVNAASSYTLNAGTLNANGDVL